MGYVPEHLMHSRGMPRTAFLLASTVAMALMSACTAFAGPNLLFLSAVLAGLALGSHWTLVPAILSDLFGVKHFAGTYTFFQVGCWCHATALIGRGCCFVGRISCS